MERRSLQILILAALLWMGGLTYVLLYLEPEASQGFVQKIFFFHVPAAFSMYLSLIVGAIFSGLYLKDRNPTLDRWAQSFMYVASLFSLIVIISGPIWAKPIWGVFWTWDPRLTTSFLIFLLLMGYCFTRLSFARESLQHNRGASIGSIIAILAVLDIPLIHYSVTLWRGIHPSVLRNPEGLPANFRTGLEVMVLASFALCYAAAMIIKMQLDLHSKARELETKIFHERNPHA